MLVFKQSVCYYEIENVVSQLFNASMTRLEP